MSRISRRAGNDDDDDDNNNNCYYYCYYNDRRDDPELSVQLFYTVPRGNARFTQLMFIVLYVNYCDNLATTHCEQLHSYAIIIHF